MSIFTVNTRTDGCCIVSLLVAFIKTRFRLEMVKLQAKNKMLHLSASNVAIDCLRKQAAGTLFLSPRKWLFHSEKKASCCLFQSAMQWWSGATWRESCSYFSPYFPFYHCISCDRRKQQGKSTAASSASFFSSFVRWAASFRVFFCWFRPAASVFGLMWFCRNGWH